MRYSMNSAELSKLNRGTSSSALGHTASKYGGSAVKGNSSKFSESVLNQKKKPGATNQVKLAGVYKIPSSIQTSY